jgi:adenylate kinase
MDIILLGAQASGKGTQAELLTRAFGIPHISSGDLFREEMEKRTTLGRRAQMSIDCGELVPDDLTIAMVLRRLQQPDCQQGALMDGFPRTLAQAKALDLGMYSQGRQVSAVIYLDVAREELYRRIAGRFICKAHQHIYNIHSSPPKVAGTCDLDGSELYQRSDDQNETVQRRLDTFFTQTVRLLDYYGVQGKVIQIEGDQAIENVHTAIVQSLSERAIVWKTRQHRETAESIH